MKKILISSIIIGVVFFIGCNDKKKKSSEVIEQKAPLIEEKTTLETSSEEQTESTTVLIAEKIENEEIPVLVDVQEEVASEQGGEVIHVMTLEEKGAELYAKCSACHGQKGEQKALGISEAIQGWDVQKTIISLTKYKNEIYGGNLRAIMIGQVVTLSNEDIEVLAQHISSL